MSGLWSQRVEQRYALRLPEDVRAWLDQEVWKHAGGAEFCRARTPEQLLEPEPGTLWAGFMMPDTLPLIGNDYGDWLCLRLAADGSLAEIVQWSHCGGDWIPYGRNLAEALLYDAAQRVLHPVAPHMEHSQLPEEQVFLLAQWATNWVTVGGEPMRGFWLDAEESLGPKNRGGLLALLSSMRVAEFAVRRDRLLHHLESPLKVAGEPALAEQLGVRWEPDFVRWLFDTDLLPDAERTRLQQILNADDSLFAQNWEAAEQEALAVIRRRKDLGWAFDIAGWAAQRRGDWANAIRNYLAGLQTSWFSDDTVRFRTHWFEEGYGKFAAFRLASLGHHLTPQQRSDPYVEIFLANDSASLQTRVHAYWLTLARQAEQQGEPAEAYRCYYRAGWDLGLQPLGAYAEIYDGLQRSARAAGAPALAALGAMYQRFLVNP